MKHLYSRIGATAMLAAVSFAFLMHSSGWTQEGLGSLQDLLPPSPGGTAPRSINGQIRLFDSVLVHPMPVWSSFENGPAPAEQTKMRTSNRNGVYTMSMIPKNEEFSAWDHQFSVIAINNPRSSIQRQAESIAAHYKSICSPSNLKIFRGDETGQKFAFVIACGSYSRKRESGQIAAVVILQNKTTAVTLSRQWQGTAYQAGLPTNWPVDKTEIENVLKELIQSRLHPVKKN